ncbi:MAG: competence protein CoiA family protein [Gammaproteobacteria bacterium]|nr:competence protein CoiA family protein [Gammaproteobacteria bacterium]
MRFALVNGSRQEAQKGLEGLCPGCSQPMIAKCGPVKAKHWAHRGECTSDSWLKPESDWHLAWKAHFPDDWQEIRHLSSNGVLHIADVKTDQNYILEFQHSYLNPEERKERQDFYKKLIWVVHAKNSKRAQAKFQELLNKSIQVFEKLPLLKLSGYLDECALLRDWAGSPAPILFDFDETATLWYLLPHSSVSHAYVVKFSKEYFITLHRDGAEKSKELDFWFNELIKLMQSYKGKQETQNQFMPRISSYRSRQQPRRLR